MTATTAAATTATVAAATAATATAGTPPAATAATATAATATENSGLHRSISPDALCKSLNDVGKGGARRPRGVSPRRRHRASAQCWWHFRQRRSQGQGRRQGNKAAGTSA